jgi:hypothetical protein
MKRVFGSSLKQARRHKGGAVAGRVYFVRPISNPNQTNPISNPTKKSDFKSAKIVYHQTADLNPDLNSKVIDEMNSSGPSKKSSKSGFISKSVPTPKNAHTFKNYLNSSKFLKKKKLLDASSTP